MTQFGGYVLQLGGYHSDGSVPEFGDRGPANSTGQVPVLTTYLVRVPVNLSPIN